MWLAYTQHGASPMSDRDNPAPGTNSGTTSSHICTHCNRAFYDGCSLRRHIVKNRCPVWKQKVQDAQKTDLYDTLKGAIVTQPAQATGAPSERSVSDAMALVESLVERLTERIVSLELEGKQMRLEFESRVENLERENQALRTNVEQLKRSVGAKLARQTTAPHPGVSSGVSSGPAVIVINNFGKEDTTHITHADKIEWARDPANGVLAYIEKKHFDPNKPQNRTIKLTSMKREEVAVHVDGIWQKQPAKPIAWKMVEASLDDLHSGVDWDNISGEAEKYFEEVSNDPRCALAKPTVQALLYLLDKYRPKT